MRAYLDTVVRPRLKEPSSLAALALLLATLKDFLPWPWAWWAAQGAVAIVIFAAVFVPERERPVAPPDEHGFWDK